MDTVARVLVALIALFHIYAMVLEMFLWTKPRGLRVFRQSLEKAEASAVLAKNQGLYNGFLVAGLLWSLLATSPEVAMQFRIFFLSCVLAAGVYGGYTVGKSIALFQGLPAAVALILTALA